MTLLATTTRGLEAVAADEITVLTGADASLHHPGMLAVDAPGQVAPLLQRYARTLNRVLVVIADAELRGLADIASIVENIALAEYLDLSQSFAVRAKRHGEHSFTSPDVEGTAGQAIVDAFEKRTGERPAVDLDDPDLIVRLFVRHDRVVVAIDVTGQYSLHRRAYREADHEAPLRPTTAAAMAYLADPSPDDRVVDPCCGCGTIPIETALLAADAPIEPTGSRSLDNLIFLDDEPVMTPDNGIPSDLAVAARDHDPDAVAATRANAARAGVDDRLTVTEADVTSDPLEADMVVADLPYGVRTGSAQLPALYEGFVDTVSAAAPDRLVLLTASPDLLPYDPVETFTVRRGNLEATLLVIE